MKEKNKTPHTYVSGTPKPAFLQEELPASARREREQGEQSGFASCEPKRAYKIDNWLIWTLVIVSFLGFMDATYLTVEHYSQTSIPCILFSGCDEVASSEYAVIWGIPTALFGVAFYISILFLSLLYYDTKKRIILTLISPLTLIGFLISLILIYLQLFVIQAVCTYCMFSALTSTTLFILSFFIRRQKKLLAPLN